MGASAFNSAYPPQVVDGLGGSALGKHQSCGWPLSPTHRTVVRVHGSPVMTRLHAPREVFGCTQTPVHHTIVSFSSTSLVHSALGIPHRLLRLRHRASSAAHRCGVAGWLTGLRIQARRRGGMPGGRGALCVNPLVSSNSSTTLVGAALDTGHPSHFARFVCGMNCAVAHD